MKTELHNYDIFPKVIPSKKKSRITVRPLGGHAEFRQGASYTVAVCPLDEGAKSEYPGRPNFFEFETAPDPDGSISFEFDFFSEQQYYVRIKNEEQKFKVQLCVYAVDEDLCGRYPFKGDLHIHTHRSDGSQSPAVVCANYRKTGYDFLAITDHRRYYPSLEAIEAYKDAPLEFAIIPGEEVHMPKDYENGRINDVHIVNFGGEYSVNAMISDSEHIKEAGEDKTKRSLFGQCPDTFSKEQWWERVDAYCETLDLPACMDKTEKFAYGACFWIFDEIRKAEGLGIFCHPYWIANVFQVPPKFCDYMMEKRPFDAYEVLGGERYFEQNGFQTIQYYEDLAKGRKYPVVGSTDSHNSVNSRGICSTIVFSPENERRALISSIKDFYSVALDTISAEMRYVGSFRLVRYACFLDQEFFPLHDDLCHEEGRAMKDYACGDEGAKKVLSAIYGRMKAQREKYFAF